MDSFQLSFKTFSLLQPCRVAVEKVRGSQKRKRRTPVCVINLSDSSDEDKDYATILEDDTAAHSFDSGCEMDQLNAELTNGETDTEHSDGYPRKSPTSIEEDTDDDVVCTGVEKKRRLESKSASTQDEYQYNPASHNQMFINGSLSSQEVLLQYISQLSSPTMQAAAMVSLQQRANAMSSQSSQITQYSLPESPILDIHNATSSQKNASTAPNELMQNILPNLTNPSLPSPQLLVSADANSLIPAAWLQSNNQAPSGSSVTRGSKHRCVTCGK